MSTKEEREAAALEKQWARAVQQAAYERVAAALTVGGMAISDQGGLVVAIPDPEGATRRYFVRLTECR
jgi:hypothetical protein